MSLVEARPEWEREWREICEAGVPLPNEVVGLVCFPDGETYAALPVVNGNEITSFVFYPMKGVDATVRQPEIVSEEKMRSHRMVADLRNTGVLEDLADKGYRIDEEYRPRDNPTPTPPEAVTRASTQKYYNWYFYVRMTGSFIFVGDYDGTWVGNFDEYVSFRLPYINGQIELREPSINDMSHLGWRHFITSSFSLHTEYEHNDCLRSFIWMLETELRHQPGFKNISWSIMADGFLDGPPTGDDGGKNSGGGGGGGGGSGGSTPPVEPPVDPPADPPITSTTPSEARTKLTEILSDSKIKTAIANNPNIPFTEADSLSGIMTVKLKGQENPITKKIVNKRIENIKFDSDRFLGLTENGRRVAVLHEYSHIALFLGSDSWDHGTMINDPDYLKGIKDIFPGRSDDFYGKMKYMGCLDEQQFKDLTPDEQEEIRKTINDNIHLHE